MPMNVPLSGVHGLNLSLNRSEIFAADPALTQKYAAQRNKNLLFSQETNISQINFVPNQILNKSPTSHFQTRTETQNNKSTFNLSQESTGTLHRFHGFPGTEVMRV